MFENQLDALQDILKKAVKDPAYRPDFYRILLESDVYVLGTLEDGEVLGGEMLKKETPANIVSWQKNDGNFFIPIFTSEQEMNKVVQVGAQYIRLNAKTLFQITVGHSYIINPGSDFTKELLPLEVKSLLDGTLQILKEHKSEEGSQILIGEPSIYPQELVDSLKVYFTRHQNISSAYIAQIQFSALEKPSLLLALDGVGDLSAVFSDLAFIIKDTIKSGEPVDMMQIGKGDELDEFFKGIKPFYAK